MKKWGWGVFVWVALFGMAAWWAAFDGQAPARAEGVFDLAAYRALVAADASAALPTEVRVEFVGEGQAPSLAVEAGALGGARLFTYASFQIVAPDGLMIVDGALDAATLASMGDGKSHFDAAAYARVLDAMTQANQVLVTHEHPDHVMAIARHPAPEALAPRLRLTRTQLDALPRYAIGGTLAPAIAAAPVMRLDEPTRIAPGIVAAPAPGHSPGSIVIFVRTQARDYFFIGDIAWMMSNVEHARGRPRFIRWVLPGVDPDRVVLLRQIRALHDIAAAEPNLVIVPAHDAEYLRARVGQGALSEGFLAAAS